MHRGSDFESDILVTLEEALTGSERTLSLQRIDRRTGRNQNADPESSDSTRCA